MFVIEYVGDGQEEEVKVKEAMDTAMKWKGEGKIRYIAVSTHSHKVAASLCQALHPNLDALMLRYNMSHRKAAQTLSFPLCEQHGIPVMAFTSTRWNALQSGHAKWKERPPTTGECLSFALAASPPVEIVLHSARDENEFNDAMLGLQDNMLEEDILKWGKYGDLPWNELDQFDEYPEEQFHEISPPSSKNK